MEPSQELVELVAVRGPPVEMETEVFVEVRNGCELVGQLLQLKVQRNFNLEHHLAKLASFILRLKKLNEDKRDVAYVDGLDE